MTNNINLVQLKTPSPLGDMQLEINDIKSLLHPDDTLALGFFSVSKDNEVKIHISTYNDNMITVCIGACDLLKNTFMQKLALKENE
jgi:hypothetical protein